jgi:hypothetical protein
MGWGIKMHNYIFSEIPNDEKGQAFVKELKTFLNSDSYKIRVKGQYLKDSEKVNRGWRNYDRGQPISKSKCLRIYIDDIRGKK